ncbi:hypothetical protein [Candidatus Accumulibacter sp. ACC012]|uniref:hypothetical protein n=1 Tax=Candidatus Accumulibacter sp. ACC012 TaxID=2823332 RepID=UPI0025BA2134|nr:hypothetical protein [Candidatus Accumulibacter sp. ACC012]
MLISGDMPVAAIVSTNITSFAVTPRADSLYDFLTRSTATANFLPETLVAVRMGLPFTWYREPGPMPSAPHEERLHRLEDQCTTRARGWIC